LRVSNNRIVVRHQDLERFIIDVLKARGMTDKDATTVAEGLVWANLRGGDGHGVSRLPRYINLMNKGEIDPKAQPRVALDGAAFFLLDCGHCFGPVALMQAIALAAERAKKAGVCFGLVREATHTGAIGRYAHWLAERGLAGIVFGTGPALMAYHGARVASLATSPITMGVPSSTGPIVLDMSSSTISNGKIVQARTTGEPLPEGTVLDKDGEPTTDARKAEILLPLGGPKGSGLGFMFEMFSSVLAGAPIQSRWLGPEKRTRHTQNSAVIAIDIATFRNMNDFMNDADDLARIIKGLPRQRGFDEILLPGERGKRTELKRRESGIPIPPKLWEELGQVANTLSVELPAAKAAAEAPR
jgi:ureidoglycolate dehydrogenase (NAD+)